MLQIIMVIKANLHINSGLLEASLTSRTVKRAVLAGLDYPGFRLDKHLKEIGLNIDLWPTWFALWEEDGLTQPELTSRCNTAHYTTTPLFDSLEQKDW